MHYWRFISCIGFEVLFDGPLVDYLALLLKQIIMIPRYSVHHPRLEAGVGGILDSGVTYSLVY